ncbi:hypothetical protein HX92_3665 [Mycobacterium tuberculosis]|nr:hypothetical protein CCDC5079_2256 [Mycobacterium tuberculosis CCDC5079]AKO25494.1 hypothetical protein GS11_2568 [Mycobacterium tuberculosis variant bovis BCG]ALB19648.1 hypothetical protein AFL40_2548 [Mycobacterium tuberculosis]BAQ06549.1 hypothetical protein KURONO_2757 [Mycobacterium tuberculosis str. Kurono]GAA46123.1 hypothetical protein NCGM2209_2754 [Mycobacterium tuberculosis NCGM2209]
MRTEPIPSTIVQKMTGAIIILIRLTNTVPSTVRLFPVDGAVSPTITPAITAKMTARYSQWVRSRPLLLAGKSVTGARSKGAVIGGSSRSTSDAIRHDVSRSHQRSNPDDVTTRAPECAGSVEIDATGALSCAGVDLAEAPLV